jgi:hypothetical protein
VTSLGVAVAKRAPGYSFVCSFVSFDNLDYLHYLDKLQLWGLRTSVGSSKFIQPSFIYCGADITAVDSEHSTLQNAYTFARVGVAWPRSSLRQSSFEKHSRTCGVLRRPNIRTNYCSKRPRSSPETTVEPAPWQPEAIRFHLTFRRYRVPHTFIASSILQDRTLGASTCAHPSGCDGFQTDLRKSCASKEAAANSAYMVRCVHGESTSPMRFLLSSKSRSHASACYDGMSAPLDVRCLHAQCAHDPFAVVRAANDVRYPHASLTCCRSSRCVDTALHDQPEVLHRRSQTLT